MIAYRFAQPRFAADLSGTGARLYGGRWNPKGIPMVYASSSISLALLEVLVNAGSLESLLPLKLMKLTLPASKDHYTIEQPNLKKKWYADVDYTQWMGKEILSSQSLLFIQCPSAVVFQEQNYLLNPLHPMMKQVTIEPVLDFMMDPRLFKQP